MEICMIMKDYIPLISVVVVVIGWFVNNILSRKHEIAKRRLEYRLGALESFLPVWFTMQKYGAPFEADPDLLKKIETARSNIQLYGKQDEIDGIERFIECLESNDVENGVKNLHKFIVLIKSRIRGELNIK